MSDVKYMTITRAEANLAREWFDAVQDLHPAYLEAKDTKFHAKLRARLALKEATMKDKEIKKAIKESMP